MVTALLHARFSTVQCTYSCFYCLHIVVLRLNSAGKKSRKIKYFFPGFLLRLLGFKLNSARSKEFKSVGAASQ